MTVVDSRVAIERCLSQYLKDPWDCINLVELARRHSALPVYADVGGSLFLTPEGQVLALSHADGNDSLRPEEEPMWQLVAFIGAAEKYPELKALLPCRRPLEPDCPTCGGTGCVYDHKLRCGDCLGLGWKIAL
jgi:hypothetical protein